MQSDRGRAAAEIGKSICVAAVVTLAAVLVFALFVKLFSIGSTAVAAVNQIIKALAVFAGCMICLRPGRCLLKGALSGLGVIVLTYFLFAIIAGSISFGWTNMLDWLFGAAVGAVSGLVAGYVRGKS